jgi:hypothetical protein
MILVQSPSISKNSKFSYYFKKYFIDIVKLSFCFCLLLLLAFTNKVYSNEFFPAVELEGETQFVIYPIETIHPNVPVLISFGIPLPKGFLSNIVKLRILDEETNELAVFIKPLSPWRNLGDLTTESSIRSALAQVNLSFPDLNHDGKADPIILTLEWGKKIREVTPIPESPVRESWVLVNNQLYPENEQIFEPKAYAIFTTQWYSKSMLKTRIYEKGTHDDFSSYDNFFELFGQTSINKVDPRISSEYITDYNVSYSAWLFDRPMALYQLAMKTGEYSAFRQAHHASQFYSQHINNAGYFDLKPVNDLKYTYAESIATNFWLTGDTNHLTVIENMLAALKSFNINYSLDSNFWTERHAAAVLSGFVVAFEVLGKAEVGQFAKDAFSALVEMQNNPVEGVPKTGALMHTRSSHGEGGDEFMSSPWMTALLVDAVERYYVHSSDPKVLPFIYKLADYFAVEGIYYTDDFFGETLPKSAVPYYMAGADLTDPQKYLEPWSNSEHCLDVSKIFALAYFFSRNEGEPNQEYLTTFSELYKTANEFVLPYWIRPAAPSAQVGENLGGMPAFRLSPARKFNWWFRSTANIDWLIGEQTRFVAKKDINIEGTHNAIINVIASADKQVVISEEIITFTLEYENVGGEDAKGLSLWGNFKTNSDYYEIVPESISHGGTFYGDNLFWSVGSVAQDSEKNSVSFSARILKPDLAFTNDHPSAALVFQATAKYGNLTDSGEELMPSVSIWDQGVHTHSRVSTTVTVPTSNYFVNKPPIAIDKSFEIIEDTTLNVILEGLDPEDKAITYELISEPSSGTIIRNDAAVNYLPNNNFNGKDSFEYKITDPLGASDVGIININVLAVNDKPDALEMTLKVEVGAQIDFVLIGQDLDGSISSFNHTSPTSGVLTGTAPNLTYTADMSYFGVDEFSFYVVDDANAQSSSSRVSITVIPFDNAPVADNQIISLNEDNEAELLLTASDVDGDQLAFAVVSQPLHGTLTGTIPHLIYTPRENFYGDDHFTFIANDGYKNSETASIHFLVQNVNDSPTVFDQNIELYKNISLDMDLTATDVENSSLTYQLLSSPSFGQLSGTFPFVTYQPNNYYTGEDSFTYQIFDGTSYSQGTIFINVKDGSEFRTYIENAIEEGSLANWIGNYILTRLSMYQEQLYTIELLLDDQNSTMEEKIFAWHSANMAILSVFSYLNYAPKDDVYTHIKGNVENLIFNTLMSQQTEFSSLYNYIYQEIIDEGLSDWALSNSILNISLIDHFYSQKFIDTSNAEYYTNKTKILLEKEIAFITTYMQNSPENINYKTIHDELLDKLHTLFLIDDIEFNVYVDDKINSNELPAWIGNYILARLNMYEAQLLVVEELDRNSDTFSVDYIKERHAANILIFSVHFYLNYANRDVVYDYINTEINQRQINTLSSDNIQFQSLYSLFYQQIKANTGASWPIGETLNYISLIDYYHNQITIDPVNAGEYRDKAVATLEKSILFMNSYIESYPEVIVYQMIKESLDHEVRTLIE